MSKAKEGVTQATWTYFCPDCGAKCVSDSRRRPPCKYCKRPCKATGRVDMRAAMPHPMQPIENDGRDVIRFKSNAIVQYLVDFGREHGCSLNELARMPFSKEDWMQLAQLTGYSVSGFGDLSYAARDVVAEADELADAVNERMAREQDEDDKTPTGKETWTPTKWSPNQ